MDYTDDAAEPDFRSTMPRMGDCRRPTTTTGLTPPDGTKVSMTPGGSV